MKMFDVSKVFPLLLILVCQCNFAGIGDLFAPENDDSGPHLIVDSADTIALRSLLRANHLDTVNPLELCQNSSYIVAGRITAIQLYFDVDTFVFTKDLAKLDSLNLITLAGIHLKAIRFDSTFYLPSVRRVILSYNDIVELPSAITQFDSLRELIIYNNQLTSLPVSLLSMTMLTGLGVSSNRLCGLSDTLVEFINRISYYRDWQSSQTCN